MTPPAPRRAALNFIFITVLLDMLALGIVVPVLPRLVVDFLHGDTARAAEVIGLFATVWALMQFIFSPLLGLLSDRYGRRRVILLSNFGLGLDYVVMALAPTVRWLFLGRVLSGITTASMTTANAYISDVTPVEKRAQAFGLLGAAFGVGFVLGPAIGGWLGATNPRLPFWFAAACSFLNAMYGLFVLPESLPPERRAVRLRWRDANPVGALALLRSHPELMGLATVNFLGYVAHEVYATVYVLYVTYRYHWGQRTIGFSLALVGIASMIVSGGVVGPAVRRLGERRALYLGLLMGAVGFAVFGLAPMGWVFMLAIPINCLWALAGPPSTSIMTQRVSPSEQGELQGAIGSVRSIAMLVGPGIFSVTFATFISPTRAAPIPGAPWYLAAAFLLVAMAVARAVLPRAATTGARSELPEARAS
ncbi:MAG TPA: TCR/Tet family MFS transporter [Vicinamibacteria bacterium]|jgi:DHA1 family tetracycline resistance protein-like MFS transporter